MKKLLLLISLLPYGSTLATDWLDEMVEMVSHHRHFHARKANAIIEKQIKKDKRDIAALEKQQKQNTSEGVLAGTRELTYKGELVTLNTNLRYHEGVARYIRELAENKKERDAFVEECRSLKKLNSDLQSLQRDLP